VEPLDVVKEIRPGFSPRPIFPAINPLPFPSVDLHRGLRASITYRPVVVFPVPAIQTLLIPSTTNLEKGMAQVKAGETAFRTYIDR